MICIYHTKYLHLEVISNRCVQALANRLCTHQMSGWVGGFRVVRGGWVWKWLRYSLGRVTCFWGGGCICTMFVGFCLFGVGFKTTQRTPPSPLPTWPLDQSRLNSNWTDPLHSIQRPIWEPHHDVFDCPSIWYFPTIKATLKQKLQLAYPNALKLCLFYSDIMIEKLIIMLIWGY